VVQPERAKADILGSASGASAPSGRPFDILIPLWVIALLGLALNWQQSLGAKAILTWTAHSQAVLVVLSAVENGVLGVDLRAAFQREGPKDAPSFLGKYVALTDQNLVELQRLTSDNPLQQAHLARLRTLIKAHRLASDSAFSQQEEFTLVAILGQLGQMQRIEQQLLADRTASEVRQLGRVHLLEAATAVATVGMLVLTTLLLKRERRWVAAANNEMSRSRERFYYLFEHANLGIAISRLDKNEGGLALQANAALAGILGVSIADVKKQGLTAFLLPEGQVTQSQALDSMLENNQPSARLTLPYRHRNGDTVWVDETMILRRSASGEESELFSLLVNITQLRSEEQLLLNKVSYTRSLIETSLDPLMAISIEGKIDDVNEATVQATGLPRGLLVGRDFSEFFTEPERARQGYQEVFSEGLVRNYPLTLRHCTGTLMPVLYNASTYLDREGKVLGVFAAARDVTQTRSMEEELRRLNATLDQKVQERTADLTQANEELESFSYSVSHDLRAPLRAIDGFSLKLVKSSGDVLDQEGRRLLQVVRDNALRMGQLIDDLLHFSRDRKTHV
jgi:PAS domain S-box-containing protein